jgi:hypothetical protein
MTDPTPTPPPAQPAPAPPAAVAPAGRGPVGKVRSPWAVIGLSIITLGIYFLYWTYQVFREMKDRTGNGVGGVIGLVIALVIGIVNWFLIPSEVGNMYAQAGKSKPVRGVTGFWNLIPIIGGFIWIFKVQGALNRAWEAG